jgi:hypothetical protein
MLSFALMCIAAAPAQTAGSMSVAERAAYNKPDREKVLYEGAKNEGKVVWYTSLAEASRWESMLRDLGRK